MSSTIKLVSEERIKQIKQAKEDVWEEYWMLTEARNQSMAALRELGETIFPEKRPESAVSVKTEAKPSIKRAINWPERPEVAEMGPQTLRDLILRAASILKEGISKDSVAEWLQNEYPNRSRAINMASLGVTFSKVANVEGWEQVVKGAGGNPSVYRLPE